MGADQASAMAAKLTGAATARCAVTVGPRDSCMLLIAASVYVLHYALADLLPGFRAVRGSL
jgi:hypothetical protein